MSQSDQRFRKILDQIEDAYYEVNLAGKLTLFNRALCRMTGRTADELMGMHFREYTDDVTADHLLDMFSRVYSTGRPETRKDWGIILKGGEHLIVEASVSLRKNEVDETIGFSGIIRDVTERRHAEHMVRKSQEWLSLLIERSPLAVIAWDDNFRPIEWNAAAEQVFGYTKEEAIGRPGLELIVPPELHNEVDDILKNILSQQGGTRNTNENVTKDGRRILCEWYNTTLFGENGRPIGAASLVLDITERERAENALKQSEEKYRRIFENMQDVYFETKLDGSIVEISPIISLFTGYTRDEVLNKRITDFYANPKDRDVLLDSLLKIGRLDNVPVISRDKDGELHPFLITAKLLKNDMGEPTGIVGSMRDNRERMLAEEQLKRSEKDLADAQRIAHVGSWSWDAKADKLRWSDETFRIYGVSPKDFTEGLDYFWGLIHPDDASRIRDMSTLAENRQKDFAIEHRIIRGDGAERVVKQQGELSYDESGNLAAVVGTVLDITDRKEAEKARMSLEAQVQQAQKLESLGVLAGGIAHDFNNLLTGVIGYASLARGTLKPGSPTDRYIDEIEKAAERAADLTNQMLAYSGKGRIIVLRVNLNTVLEELSNLLRASVSKKAHLTFNLAKDLPFIDADTAQLPQVVMNLITNASDALDDEPGRITVSTGVMEADEEYLSSTYLDDERAPGTYVYFETKDTGCGMDAQTLDKIFDPFFTTKFMGRGLGLAALLGIVRGHGGTIKIDTEVGKGTTFRVLFPAAGTSEDGETAGTAPEADAAPPSRKVQGTILVVDDEAVVRELSETILREAGYDVLLAKDGIEGVETFARHAQEITLVLLDLTMPNMDGQEALKKMRDIRADVRVVMSSGYNEEEVSARFERNMPAGFIHKPYRVELLLSKVSSVLES